MVNKKEVYYMPGYSGHLAGVMSDGLNMGETTARKLERASLLPTINENGGRFKSTAEYISSGKIGMMPMATRNFQPGPDPVQHRIRSRHMSMQQPSLGSPNRNDFTPSR